MARKRTIDPGFFRNDALGECSPLARLFFAGLWCWADRDGRLEDRPKRLAAEILPYDRAEGEALMQELASAGLVVRYEVGGSKYVEIPTFGKYQNPHPKETPSRCPPREGSPKVDLRQTQGEPKERPGVSEGEPFRAQPSSLLASSPSRPSQPSSPPNPQRQAGRANRSTLVHFRTELGLRLGYEQMLPVGRDEDRVLDAFERQLEAVTEDQLLVECMDLARKSTTGTPGSLAWFVPWLERLPLRAVAGGIQ